MTTIQKDNFIFLVDMEKTKEYYSSNTLCTCSFCRNLYAQIETMSDKLTSFLSEFGIDPCRPDEAASLEMEDFIDYLFVGYTVTGSIETDGAYETCIDDFHITVSQGETVHDWFPNEQKEPHFFVSVSGIALPWVLDEPFPKAQPLAESFTDKCKAFLKRISR